MKIKIGTEVRIRRTDEIATVIDFELIRKQGRVMKYCHLKTPSNHPDLWIIEDELGDPVEVCTIKFAGSNKKALATIELRYDYRTSTLSTDYANRPVNLLTEEKMPILMFQFFLRKLREAEEIEY